MREQLALWRWRKVHMSMRGAVGAKPLIGMGCLGLVAAAALGFVLERTLYVHMYGRSHLDQVLFSIGLVFMAVTAVDWAMGSSQQNIKLPAVLQPQQTATTWLKHDALRDTLMSEKVRIESLLANMADGSTRKQPVPEGWRTLGDHAP